MPQPKELFFIGGKYMKLKEYLLEKMKLGKENRIKRLKEINAPEIIIENEKKQYENILKGNINLLINKWNDNDFDVEFIKEERKTGNGGKVYFQFTTKDNKIINFFPNAKYGRFICYNK